MGIFSLKLKKFLIYEEETCKAWKAKIFKDKRK